MPKWDVDDERKLLLCIMDPDGPSPNWQEVSGRMGDGYTAEACRWDPESERALLLFAMSESDCKPSAAVWDSVAKKIDPELTGGAVSQKFGKLKAACKDLNKTAAPGTTTTSGTTTTTTKPKKTTATTPKGRGRPPKSAKTTTSNKTTPDDDAEDDDDVDDEEETPATTPTATKRKRAPAKPKTPSKTTKAKATNGKASKKSSENENENNDEESEEVDGVDGDDVVGTSSGDGVGSVATSPSTTSNGTKRVKKEHTTDDAGKTNGLKTENDVEMAEAKPGVKNAEVNTNTEANEEDFGEEAA